MVFLREEILDANGPLAREGQVGRILFVGSQRQIYRSVSNFKQRLGA